MPRSKQKPRTVVTIEMTADQLERIRLEADRYELTVAQWIKVIITSQLNSDAVTTTEPRRRAG